MAKALLGHLGPSDLRTVVEIRRLRQRIQDLESEINRLQTENSALAAAVQHEELLTLTKEPALA